tara:strand:+ start:108 stop:779 length:672 start_codon:yes stop_codon:yes gene_type:complete
MKTKTYKIPQNIDHWDFENSFYLTCDNNRISDTISHLELYKMILDIPGDVLEFGVFKGGSLIKFLSFREYYEHHESRKITGFDIFGKFPDNSKIEDDNIFAHEHDTGGGYGISKYDLNNYLKKKGFKNYDLIKGDINNTLPKFLNKYPEKRYSLVHIDVDVYEPTKTILHNIWNKIVKGGILILDDYGTVEGETVAVDEFFAPKKIEVKKLPFKYKPSYIIKN